MWGVELLIQKDADAWDVVSVTPIGRWWGAPTFASAQDPLKVSTPRFFALLAAGSAGGFGG